MDVLSKGAVPIFSNDLGILSTLKLMTSMQENLAVRLREVFS